MERWSGGVLATGPGVRYLLDLVYRDGYPGGGGFLAPGVSVPAVGQLAVWPADMGHGGGGGGSLVWWEVGGRLVVGPGGPLKWWWLFGAPWCGGAATGRFRRL